MQVQGFLNVAGALLTGPGALTEGLRQGLSLDEGSLLGMPPVIQSFTNLLPKDSFKNGDYPELNAALTRLDERLARREPEPNARKELAIVGGVLEGVPPPKYRKGVDTMGDSLRRLSARFAATQHAVRRITCNLNQSLPETLQYLYLRKRYPRFLTLLVDAGLLRLARSAEADERKIPMILHYIAMNGFSEKIVARAVVYLIELAEMGNHQAAARLCSLIDTHTEVFNKEITLDLMKVQRAFEMEGRDHRVLGWLMQLLAQLRWYRPQFFPDSESIS